MQTPDSGNLALPALVEAQYRLGYQRSSGATGVAVYTADQPGGFGPALQIVTDNATMLMDSVTVLLHRVGVAYVAIMNPVFRVRRGATGEILEIAPPYDATFGDGTDETWVHVQLSNSVDSRALAEAETLLPRVLADARQVVVDSTAMAEVLQSLAAELDSDAGHDVERRFPGPDRKDVAALLRWLADGHFVLLGYQRCPIRNGETTIDESSRLGVLRLRHEMMPQLTGEADLLAMAQAIIQSFLRYGAYPQIVAVRETVPESDGSAAMEHRFVGLFTVAATNANVFEIPLVSRRSTMRWRWPTKIRPIPDSCCSTSFRPFRAPSCSRSAPGECSTWRWRSSSWGRAAAHCCSCGPIHSPTSRHAWCTCPATVTPPPYGWRCRTSWSVSSAASA